MNHSALSVYRISKTLSTRKNRISRKGGGAPAPKYPHLVANLNKFVELYDGNESEAARQLGVPAAQLWEWRNGLHVPATLSRGSLAAKLGTSVDALMHGEVREFPVEYKRPPDLKRQRLQESFDHLTSDDYVIKEIEAMFKILSDLRFARSAKVDREQVLLYLRELSDEDRQRVLDDVVERGEELDQAGHIREAVQPPGQTVPFKKKDSPEGYPAPDSEEKVKAGKK